MSNNNYSEFYTEAGAHMADCQEGGCKECGLTSRYTQAFRGDDAHVCHTCHTFQQPTFKGLQALQRNLDLQAGERIGVTTSGGKDSLHALTTMVDLLGPGRVVALTHHKQGLTHPLAEFNLKQAVGSLGVKLIVVEERKMLARFRQNLALLLKDPDPALVRVVLCAGCRHGITKDLYAAGVREGIRKYVSAASYLELAPFKEELLARKGAGDLDAGFRKLMSEHQEYNYGDNMFYIERDNGLKYKSNSQDGRGGLKDRIQEYQLFDLDDYLPNDPEAVEKVVRERFGWRRPERSWHFDCEIEKVKDVFYYGLLGFTETDFKLAAMVRHGLLTEAEAHRQLAVVRYGLEHSYPEMERFLRQHGLASSQRDLQRFYVNSDYLKLDQQAEQPEEPAVYTDKLAWGMA